VEFQDLVSRLHVALLKHAEVKAGTAVRDEQRRNPRVVHADPDAVAGDPRLRDLEDRTADLVVVADADLVVAGSVDGEVLAELAGREVVAAELAFPVAVRIELVDEDCTLLAAMAGKVALAVSVDVQLAHPTRAGDGLLEHAREDRLPLPGDVLRHADVDGRQGAHRSRGRAHASVSVHSDHRFRDWLATGSPPTRYGRSVMSCRCSSRIRHGWDAACGMPISVVHCARASRPGTP
jgi:hypothetical protein